MLKKSKILKGTLLGLGMMGVAVFACACGDEDKVEPQNPTKYIRQADETVDEYNEGVNQINEASDAMDNAE